MKRATLAVLIVLSVQLVPAAGARQEPGDLVSKELVERLLAGYGSFGRTTIIEGLPPEAPAELVPAGGVPRLTASSRGLTLVLVEAAEFAPADRPRYERQLAAAGWARAAQGRVQRGLSMSPSAPVEMLCRDGEHATYAASPKREGGWWVHVSVMRFGGRSSCDALSMGPGAMTSVFEDARMPGLIPPDESRVASMSGSLGDEHQEQEMRLETRLSAAEVAGHYAAQLTAHGWKAEAEASVEGITLVRFAAPLGPNDKPIPATVSAVTLDEDAVSLTLRVFVAGGRGR
jgi:hypothetical protein